MPGPKNKKYGLKTYVLSFLAFGCFGVTLEVMWTGFGSLIAAVQQNRFSVQTLEMIGHTGVWCFFDYGIASIPFMFLAPWAVKRFPNRFGGVPLVGFFIRGTLYAMFIFAAEFVSGMFGKYVLGVHMHYDYTGHPLSVLGLIDLASYPVWFAIGIMGEFIALRILRLRNKI